MSTQFLQWGYLVVALLLANIPWLSEQRYFLIGQCSRKTIWMRLLEWFFLYVVVMGLGYLLENRVVGGTHAQDWEFYAVTLSLFMVAAFPGFIYRHVR